MSEYLCFLLFSTLLQVEPTAAMSWLCISCETVNYSESQKCIVCGVERFYSFKEVKNLLENNPEYKTLQEQNKKLTQQNKWLQTRNRNLTQENKQLKEILAELEKKSLENPQNTYRSEKKQENNNELSFLPKENTTNSQNPQNQNFFCFLQEKIFWGELTALLSTFWAIFWAAR